MLARPDDDALAGAVATAQVWARDFPLETADWRAMQPDLWGNIAVTPSPDGKLLIFSYTDRAQHAGVWTPLERVCRGLILEAGTGAIVARPWPKFFNWGELDDGERQRLATVGIDRVSEKLDGSLIIVYHHAGGWHAATRGSFTSPQARHAQAMLDSGRFRLDILPGGGDWTYLCELITPRNRVVIDYGARDELVLLDIAHNESGAILSPYRVPATAETVGFAGVGILSDAALDRLDARLLHARGVEGWVVSWLDGFNPERVREALVQRRLAEYQQALPEEFWAQCAAWAETIDRRLQLVTEAARGNYAAAYHEAHEHGDGSRKAFAEAARALVGPDALWMLFMLYDGKSIRDKLLARLDLSDLGAATFDTWKGDKDGAQGGGDEQPDLGAGQS
jgi:hypothetical protein